MLCFQKCAFWEILRTRYSNNAIKIGILENFSFFVKKILDKKWGGVK